MSRRETIVEEAVSQIERAWREDAAFDRDTIACVCELSAKFGYSQAFLAYSHTYVWQIETGIEEIRV
jgi:hypothetical protein